VLADKAYDADRIRDLIQQQGATPNIPTKEQPQMEAILQQAGCTVSAT
jgi:transposase